MAVSSGFGVWPFHCTDETKWSENETRREARGERLCQRTGRSDYRLLPLTVCLLISTHTLDIS